jgi:hypothetical protein
VREQISRTGDMKNFRRKSGEQVQDRSKHVMALPMGVAVMIMMELADAPEVGTRNMRPALACCMISM